MEFVQVFQDDDEGYLRWVAQFRHGYVVNAERSLRPINLVLHRSSCHTINGTPALGVAWTRGYIKICAMSKGDLRDWAKQVAGGELHACGFCAP